MPNIYILRFFNHFWVVNVPGLDILCVYLEIVSIQVQKVRQTDLNFKKCEKTQKRMEKFQISIVE